MKTFFIDEDIKYTGQELCPHWIYKNFKLQNNAIVAFEGEVDVKIDNMVDIEDVINVEPIYSKKMLNFIVEIFEIPLKQGVLIQRLLITTIKENLEKRGIIIKREGDDLFFEGRKLSVSIATKSLTSCLIHTGLNIEKEGAPIEVATLKDFNIADIKKFANDVMKDFSDELLSIDNAVSKVRGV